MKFLAMVFVTLGLLAWGNAGNAAEPNWVESDFGDFKIVVNCDHRAADLVISSVTQDKGNAERSNYFKFDENVPRECQQTSNESYKGNTDGAPYQRGHYMAFNTRDDTDLLARETNIVTNITPMTRSLNVDTYYETEMLTECYREIEPLLVFTGPIWGNDYSNDFFMLSHGVKTPDYVWKLIYGTKTQGYIAWIMPNTHTVSEHVLADYQVTFSTLLDALNTDNPYIAKNSPWPSILVSDEKLSNTLIQWPVEKVNRSTLSCQGHTASLG